MKIMRPIFAFAILAIASFNAQAVETIKASSVKTLPEYPSLHIVDHPLVQQKLTILRDKRTQSPEFKQLLREIGTLMGYEVTRYLSVVDVKIETPVAKTIGKKLKEEVVIAPILRAGLGMADGLNELIPAANLAHIGLYRDPKTKEAVEYLFKHPKIEDQLFIVVDPMLATGNSAIYGVQKLIDAGVAPDHIVFMALVVAPEGLKKFVAKHPKVQIYTAALDEKLDSNAYIIPGLGDAGDRLYGTK